jgi:hypothetical protein
MRNNAQPDPQQKKVNTIRVDGVSTERFCCRAWIARGHCEPKNKTQRAPHAAAG